MQKIDESTSRVRDGWLNRIRLPLVPSQNLDMRQLSFANLLAASSALGYCASGFSHCRIETFNGEAISLDPLHRMLCVVMQGEPCLSGRDCQHGVPYWAIQLSPNPVVDESPFSMSRKRLGQAVVEGSPQTALFELGLVLADFFPSSRHFSYQPAFPQRGRKQACRARAAGCRRYYWAGR
jgi:hypothetical protein